MSTKLITGYSGERSVTPDDDAQLYSALLGGSGGDFILPAEGRMAANLESNNLISIASGYVAIQGRIARHYSDEYAVDTCASGYKRIDLVILRYSKNEEGIEAAEVMVLKGEEVTETPEAPEINEGSITEGAATVDMILYRIDLAGSSVTVAQVAPVWDGYSTIGKYYTASGESDINSGQYGTICTVTTQEAGVYLLLGSVAISKSVDEMQSSRFNSITNGEAILPLRFARTPLQSGGGVTILGLVRFNEGGGTVAVESYGRSGASPWSATAIAIKVAN